MIPFLWLRSEAGLVAGPCDACKAVLSVCQREVEMPRRRLKGLDNLTIDADVTKLGDTFDRLLDPLTQLLQRPHRREHSTRTALGDKVKRSAADRMWVSSASHVSASSAIWR